jgi:hypothetical protein
MRTVSRRAIIMIVTCLLILGAVPATSWAMTNGKKAIVLAHKAAVVGEKITRLERQVAVAPHRSQTRQRVVRLGWQVVRINSDMRRLTRLAQRPGTRAAVRLRVNRLVGTVAALDSRMLDLCAVFTGSQARTYTRTVTAAARSLDYWRSYWLRHPAPTPTPAPAPAAIPPSTGSLDLNPPNGYVYNGGGVASTSGTITLGSNCTIVGVKFTGGGIRIKGNGNTVRGCTFGANPWASLLIYVGNDNVIAGNTFNEATASGSSIQMLGGKRNQITGNVTRGGVTAIASLYSRSVNGGGAASLIEDNVISGNTCSGFSEEGITFDVLGNQALDIPALEYDHIRAAGGSSVTLSSLPFPSYVGYDVVYLSGALAGHTAGIVAQSGAAFTLAAAATGALVNDQVVIGAPFKDNVVSGNTVSAAPGNNAILLYGMAFGNRIENNHVLVGNIKVESLDNLVIASGAATGTYGRAPCGYNTVKGNVVAGNVSLEYYAIPTISGHSNTYSPYVSVGNNVVGNTCTRIDANQQVAFISGNSGSTSLSDVTLSPVEMVP